MKIFKFPYELTPEQIKAIWDDMKCPEDCDGDCELNEDGLPCALGNVKISCEHEWVEYVGLNITEVYCKKCGVKK